MPEPRGASAYQGRLGRDLCMHENGIAVLQRQNSPYTILVNEALRILGVSPVYLSSPPKDVSPGPFTPWLMIWDLNVYSVSEKSQIAAELKEMPHGLVILSGRSSVADKEVFSLPGALAWLSRPRGPGELAVAILVASSLYERHTEILARLAQIRLELNTRNLLDRAKRVVMINEKVSEQYAMTKLKDCSRNLNRRMMATAREISHLGGFAKLCVKCKIASCPYHPNSAQKPE